MLRHLLALLLIWTVWIPGGWITPAGAQVVKGVTLVTPELIADVNGVAPGKPFTAGLHLRMAPGWHTYWLNPGDSGLPIAIEWNLPEGWKAGAIQWPIPDKHLEPGDLITFGYEEEVVLLVELTPPAVLPPGEAVIQAKASWLVCEQSCVPGRADLELKLPVTAAPEPAHGDLFAKFRARLPKPGAPPFALKWEPIDTEVFLKIGALPPGAQIDFFPVTPIQRHPEVISPGVIRIPFPPHPEPAFVQGLLVVKQKGIAAEGWLVESRPPKGMRDPVSADGQADTGSTDSPGSLDSTQAGTSAGGAPLTLLPALALGFIGGFILNLMPCVLPVIALKIFGFLGQAGESRQRVFKVGLAFVAGIFAWFIGLAALVVAARAAGHEVTWAFQFQNPYFVFGMAVLVFVFALNLLGVFEIWLPGTGRLVSLSEKEGYGGAFMHGMFATLLATPCTAPFLGPALAFAFAQSGPFIFAMFIAIAAGMGSPYLILTAKPGWMRFLPKPGLWMVRLKQLMGFLLLGTVVWLLGVIGSQQGLDGIVGASWVLLGIGIACWIFGTWVTPGARALQQLLAVVAMALAIGVGTLLARPAGQPAAGEWEPWSPEKVAALQKEGKPIFVDFTADWCLNCKYNERFVLEAEPVRAALKGFATLKADWTKGDPVISAELKRLGRAGVPVYVVYPAKNGIGGEPELLPELLTQSIVIEALERATR